jgi:hypothetical protein
MNDDDREYIKIEKKVGQQFIYCQSWSRLIVILGVKFVVLLSI